MTQSFSLSAGLTEALVGDVEVPEVNTQVVAGQIGLAIGIGRDGVDMVGVSYQIKVTYNALKT